ncbi:hypothetical protein JCM6882_002683 [Rhodosporidiobolus microsporus]
MSQSNFGVCCVCGEGTTTRCGSCAEAGFDLFFCSKEHQKLIWPHHKRVCGPRSNPFIWPGLTQDEAEEAKKLLMPDRADTALYKVCVQIATCVKIDPPNPLIRAHQSVDHWAQRKAGGVEEKEPFPPSAVFPQTAAWAVLLGRRFFPQASNDEASHQPSWLPAVFHQLLAIATLAVRSSSPTISEEERESTFTHLDRGWELLRGIVSEQAMPTHPEEAARFLDALKNM